jgi:hypothetical protein
MTTQEIKTVKIIKIETGFYWIIDAKSEEWIDGSSRKYVVLDMCKRWGYKIVK